MFAKNTKCQEYILHPSGFTIKLRHLCLWLQCSIAVKVNVRDAFVSSLPKPCRVLQGAVQQRVYRVCTSLPTVLLTELSKLPAIELTVGGVGGWIVGSVLGRRYELCPISYATSRIFPFCTCICLSWHYANCPCAQSGFLFIV